MTSQELNINRKIKKYSSSSISRSDQEEWLHLNSLPDVVETMDDNRLMSIYLTETKSFYCWRSSLEIENTLYWKDTLISVIIQKETSVDENILKEQVESEPKGFQRFILAVLKGYSVFKLGKEVVNEYKENEEEISQKIKSAKRIVKDYFDEILDALEESL